jgi:hypothetical protein
MGWLLSMQDYLKGLLPSPIPEWNSDFSVAIEKGDIAVVHNYTTRTVDSIAKTSTNVF